MSLRCKPGDLAIVVTDPTGKNLGKLVKTEAFIGSYKSNGVVAYDVWAIRLLCNFEDNVGRIYRAGGMGFSRDSYLRPIGTPGDNVPDESQAWLPPVPGWHLADQST